MCVSPQGPGGPASSGLRRQVSHIISQCPEYSALEPGVRENIWDKVSKEHPNAASRVDMRRYDVRMATFNDNPLNWCLRTPTPERLARVGLYYLGVEDGVRCFSCGVELDEWDEEGTLEPLLRHFLARPHCSFLQQDFHDQLPRLREQSAQQSKYANTSQRLHSFAQWPYSDVVTSYQLASVGFYYTGEGAMVTCFSCGLVIKEWKRGDVPLLVHCRRNPDCRFISSIIKKGTPSSAQAQAPVPVLKTLTTADSGAATNRPNFSDQETRLKSFKKLSPLFPISRQNLAEAGLYLLRLPDVMKCHCCSAVLQAWVDGDVAVEKHRAANPECPFLAEKFPCKLDQSVSLDFDPSNLPAAQFDENELEMMARQQSVSPPTAHTHSPFLHLQPPSLPTPDSLHMAGLSLSDIPSHPHTLPSSHTPNSYSGVPAHHTSLADSQPPSLPTLTASLSSPTGEPQPMSLSATLTHTHPPSHNASSGYHSNTHTLALSSGVPHTHPYSGTDTPLSGYHSSSRQSMEYRTDTIPLTSSGFNLSSHPPSSNTPFSPLSTTEVGGKSVSLPPSYSQAPHPAQTMPSTATQVILLYMYILVQHNGYKVPLTRKHAVLDCVCTVFSMSASHSPVGSHVCHTLPCPAILPTIRSRVCGVHGPASGDGLCAMWSHLCV